MKDIKAPMIEMSFSTSSGETEKFNAVRFNKIGLQSFFEELEKIQNKLDEIS